MRKALLVVLAMALAPACVFALDGVVLINQSTVMAAGGFPYAISQPGSYKLSGNLTPPANTDAIHISANFVTFDLNGFNVSCSAAVGSVVNCISNTAIIQTITVLNGTVRIDQPPSLPGNRGFTIIGINIGGSIAAGVITVHDVTVLAPSIDATALAIGSQSLVRHNVVTGIMNVANGSLIVENLTNGGGQIITGPNSKLVNNIP